jgi:hypothetical protein
MCVEMSEWHCAGLEKSRVPQLMMQKPISVAQEESRRKMIEMNKWLGRAASNARL